MLIDWFTVGAQIVNFLILVWLLKRYLYHPVRAAIDAREKDLALRRDTLIADQERADNDRAQWQRQKELLEQQHVVLVAAVRNEAASERSRLLQEAVHDVEDIRLARLKGLKEETANYQLELIRLTRQEIMAIVRKMLVDLASAELERSIVEVFLRRLEDTSIPAIRDESGSGSTPLTIRMRSAFALSELQRQAVAVKCEEKFKTKALLTFETSPALGLGVELTVQNQKIAWNIDDYLESFATRLAEFTNNPPVVERAAS